MATLTAAKPAGAMQVQTSPRKTVTQIFNSITTGASDVLDVTSSSQLVVVRRTANTSASTVVIQGSVDNVLWNDIASVTTAVGTANTAPWPYLRANVTVITNTAKTAASVTQTGGVATFTSNSHGFLAGEYVTVASANEAGYNGSKLILTADTNTFTRHG